MIKKKKKISKKKIIELSEFEKNIMSVELPQENEDEISLETEVKKMD